MVDFNKRFQKASKPHSIKNWWKQNGYKVWRVVFFIPYLICLFINFVDKKRRNRDRSKPFDPIYAKKILDKWLPAEFVKVLKYENQVLISTDDDYCDIYIGAFSSNWIKNKKQRQYYCENLNDFKDYILNTYEIDGWCRYPITNWMEWDKAKEKFGWESQCWNKDYAKGVVFYKEYTNG